MKDKIMRAALRLAERDGFREVSRAAVAVNARIAAGSISYHFGNMKKFQNAIVGAAVATKNLVIIGQALAVRHPIALKAPAALKAKALKAMTAA